MSNMEAEAVRPRKKARRDPDSGLSSEMPAEVSEFAPSSQEEDSGKRHIKDVEDYKSSLRLAFEKTGLCHAACSPGRRYGTLENSRLAGAISAGEDLPGSLADRLEATYVWCGPRGSGDKAVLHFGRSQQMLHGHQEHRPHSLEIALPLFLPDCIQLIQK